MQKLPLMQNFSSFSTGWRWIVVEKWYNRWLCLRPCVCYAYQPTNLSWIYIARSSWYLGSFAASSCQKFVKTKKVLPSNRGAFRIVVYGKSQRWSPWRRPWPRGRPREYILKSLASKVQSLASKPQVLENCPVLGSRTALFFDQLKFCWKTPETSRKICEYLFYFRLLEHRRSQGEGLREPAPPPPPQLKFQQWQKCNKKVYCFFSFSFFLAFFAYNCN